VYGVEPDDVILWLMHFCHDKSRGDQHCIIVHLGHARLKYGSHFLNLMMPIASSAVVEYAF
jgi:hypothetical protein